MILYVFLGKKLLSVDTIIPIIIFLKEKFPKLRVCFFVPDSKTFEDIQKNHTLAEYINSHCMIIRLGGLSKNPFQKMWQRAIWLLSLILVFITLKFRFAKALHFGALEEWPRRLVTFSNRDRIFYFESNSWGGGEFVDQIAAISRTLPPVQVVRSAKTLVSFSNNWRVRLLPDNKELRHVKLTPSKLWPSWLNYLQQIAPQQIHLECDRLGIKRNAKVIVFIMGTLDALPSFGMGHGSIDDIVRDTIQIISDAAPNTPILLKPHPITQINRLEKIVSESKNTHLTYLHPGILSEMALVAICNYYSTALNELWCKNVPTIEYSRYSAAGLRITNGGSMRPEFVSHFIEIGNSGELSEVIASYTNSSNRRSQHITAGQSITDDEETICRLFT